MFEEKAKQTPSGRVGEGKDIAIAAISLMVGTFTNGTTVTVDGGFHLI